MSDWNVAIEACLEIARKEPNKYAIESAIRALSSAQSEPDLINQLQRLLQTIRYIAGIAERGEGRLQRDDETVEQFILGYVKKLEACVQSSEQDKADALRMALEADQQDTKDAEIVMAVETQPKSIHITMVTEDLSGEVTK